MAFWTPRKKRPSRGLPVWHLESDDRTLTCVLNPEEGARVTLVVATGATVVATCTHATRRDAVAHAGFLLDRFTACGWRVLSGMREAAPATSTGETIGLAEAAMPSAIS